MSSHFTPLTRGEISTFISEIGGKVLPELCLDVAAPAPNVPFLMAIVKPLVVKCYKAFALYSVSAASQRDRVAQKGSQPQELSPCDPVFALRIVEAIEDYHGNLYAKRTSNPYEMSVSVRLTSTKSNPLSLPILRMDETST